MKTYMFTRFDIINCLVDWKLEPLTEKEKSILLEVIIHNERFAIQEDDIESLILLIISENY